jgi:hypothetical protein
MENLSIYCFRPLRDKLVYDMFLCKYNCDPTSYTLFCLEFACWRVLGVILVSWLFFYCVMFFL